MYASCVVISSEALEMTIIVKETFYRLLFKYQHSIFDAIFSFPLYSQMALFITSLNSGSNGNCYYVGNSQEAVLIDAGISCRETEKRMLRLGLNILNVKAIFISHEHSDHIKGVIVLSKKYRLPVYITEATFKSGRLKIEKDLVKTFKANESVNIGELSVLPFSKIHDAADPHSFTVSSKGVNVGVITDIGIACKEVVQQFKKCHAAFLEANYDVQMLEGGRYPFYLKKRISGGEGHISNKQALDLFLEHRPAFMSHLILSHLSKNNNTPELVNELFTTNAGSVNIVVASRYEETAVYNIKNDKSAVRLKQAKPIAENVQMSLF